MFHRRSRNDCSPAPSFIRMATLDAVKGNAASLDRLSLLAMLYLALPNFIFLGGWIRPALGWTAIIFLILGLRRIADLINWRSPSCITPMNWVLVSVAIVWASFGGAGHLFFSTHDWITRGAVMRDMTVLSWPISYGVDNGYPLILRCPLAYYLPSALMAKVLGAEYVDGLLWGWTVIGVWLILELLPLSRQSLWRLALGLLVVVFFSGMDALPFLLHGMTWPLGSNVEWWSWPYQYSSNTTLLLWAPNHALPAWLTVGLFLRHWQHPDFGRLVPFLAGLLPLWSPFALVGLAPFLGLSLVFSFGRASWRFHCLDWLPSLVLLGLVAAYFTLDTGGIVTVPKLDRAESISSLLYDYVVFYLLEVGVLGALIYRVAPSGPLLLALVCLLLIPLGNYGPGNDWVTRTSIPALMILCAAVLEIIRSRSFFEYPWRFRLAAMILLIGVATPVNEFYRSISSPAWPFDLNQGLSELRKGERAYPSHYVAHLNGIWSAGILDIDLNP